MGIPRDEYGWTNEEKASEAIFDLIRVASGRGSSRIDGTDSVTVVRLIIDAAKDEMREELAERDAKAALRDAKKGATAMGERLTSDVEECVSYLVCTTDMDKGDAREFVHKILNMAAQEARGEIEAREASIDACQPAPVATLPPRDEPPYDYPTPDEMDRLSRMIPMPPRDELGMPFCPHCEQPYFGPDGWCYACGFNKPSPPRDWERCRGCESEICQSYGCMLPPRMQGEPAAPAHSDLGAEMVAGMSAACDAMEAKAKPCWTDTFLDAVLRGNPVAKPSAPKPCMYYCELLGRASGPVPVCTRPGGPSAMQGLAPCKECPGKPRTTEPLPEAAPVKPATVQRHAACSACGSKVVITSYLTQGEDVLSRASCGPCGASWRV